MDDEADCDELADADCDGFDDADTHRAEADCDELDDEDCDELDDADCEGLDDEDCDDAEADCDDMDEGRYEGLYAYCWPPVAMSSSSSVSSIAPAGFSGSCDFSSSLMEARNSGSFQARMILSCNMDFPPYARNSRTAPGICWIRTSDPSVVS